MSKIIINGIVCETIEQLENEITALSDYQKQLLKNDFNAIQNTVVGTLPPVTNQQLRSALVIMSFQQNRPELHPDSIKGFIETLPEPNRSLALQQWEYSNEMLRSNALVNSMAASLGLTSTDLDNVWVFARTL